MNSKAKDWLARILAFIILTLITAWIILNTAVSVVAWFRH